MLCFSKVGIDRDLQKGDDAENSCRCDLAGGCAGPGSGLGSYAAKCEFRRLLEAVQAHMEPINAIHAFLDDVLRPAFGALSPPHAKHHVWM